MAIKSRTGKTVLVKFLRRLMPVMVFFPLFKFPVVVIDRSVGWTSISYRALFFRLILRGILLVELQDLLAWKKLTKFQSVTPDECSESHSVVYGVCDEHELTRWEVSTLNTDEIAASRKKYHAEYTLLYSKLEALRAIRGISATVYCQGYMSGAAACRNVSIMNDIPLLALENTANEERLLWENISGIAVNRTLARNYFWRNREFLSEKQVELYRIEKINTIRDKKRSEHRSGAALLPIGEPYVLFIGQVYTDTSTLFGASEGWYVEDVVRELCSEVERRGLRLVCKLHPKEHKGRSSMSSHVYNSLTYRKLMQVNEIENCEHIIIDHENEFDTFGLIQGSEVVVTMNSQAGLEATLYGKPVLTCAPSNYSGLGFTYDCGAAGELNSLLSQALHRTEAEGAQMLREASAFDYIYYEKYCIAKKVGALVDKLIDVSKSKV